MINKLINEHDEQERLMEELKDTLTLKVHKDGSQEIIGALTEKDTFNFLCEMVCQLSSQMNVTKKELMSMMYTAIELEENTKKD